MKSIIYGKDRYKNARGISLIELSIVLTISGMILVPLLIMAQIYMEQYRQEKLLRLEKIVHNTMKAYMQKYNRYPCPALRPTASNPSAFGDGGENCSSAPVIEGARSAWSDAIDSDKNRVLTGVFPEYTTESGVRIYLKSFIPSDEPLVRDFIDPWGGRLSYFVTKGLTNSSSFKSLNGTIAVVDENGNATDGIDKNALYALISHGSDKAGAVNVNGIVSIPCPGASEHELENPACDAGSMATKPIVSGLIRKRGGARNVTDGTVVKSIHDYYNDHVFSRRFYERDLWIPLPEGNNARVNLYSQKGKKIGIGISNPQEALDLVGPPSATTGGDIRIDRALVMGFNKYTTISADKEKTGLVCTTKDDDNDGVIDENGNGQLDGAEMTCVNPISFFNLKCPSGEYIKGISIDNNTYNVTATCEAFRVTPPVTGHAPECPSNKVIRGIYSNGNIMCASGEVSDNGSNHPWVLP